MNNRVWQNYQQLAQQVGLRLDPEGGALYGRFNGYDLVIYAPNTSYPYMLTVMASVCSGGMSLGKEELRQFKREHKPVTALTQNGYVLTMSLKNITRQERLQEELREALNGFTAFLKANGFQNCCQTCGQTGETDPCCLAGSYLQLCPSCFTALQQNQVMDQSQKRSRRENLISGIVGALIGSLLGVASIVILSQLGYVAALSGMIMAVATLKGYELLGGKLTRKGVVISILIMLVMTYVGDRLDWAILIDQELGAGILPSFRAVPYLLEEELIEAASYWTNLLLIYVFLLLGAVPTVYHTIKSRKMSGRLYRLDRTSSTL
jgi:hypothetical protein